MKITDFNVAIVESDSHLSRWVVEHGRLDVARGQIMAFAKYIPDGAFVLDIGASIGDHTATYSELVGPTGHVFAYEPNLPAFECLAHNAKAMGNVLAMHAAVGRKRGRVRVEPYGGNNLGMARVVTTGDLDKMLTTVDADVANVPWRVDFIKIDVEGYEPEVIAGAMETLKRDRPVLFVEIQKEALAMNGFTSDDILRPLLELGYRITPWDGTNFGMVQIDVLCTPISEPKIKIPGLKQFV